jgi:2-oxoisovalerate dehydrogenase E2 component (dihydrolipoyl transacylase)
VMTLNNVQKQIFKVMTESLSIPHFLYSHTISIGAAEHTRKAIVDSKILSPLVRNDGTTSKLSLLPFVMKAISQTFKSHPRLNAHLDLKSNPSKPQVILRGAHHFGIAVDTPQGLLVPVVKDVQNHSIVSLAAEIGRLSRLAQAGKLTPDDLKGATFTVSNIGSIGGGVVAPVIVGPQVAIVGLGKTKWVAGFEINSAGEEVVVKKPELALSWSADHRVLDGATIARCAEMVGALLENTGALGLFLS